MKKKTLEICTKVYFILKFFVELVKGKFGENYDYIVSSVLYIVLSSH